MLLWQTMQQVNCTDSTDLTDYDGFLGQQLPTTINNEDYFSVNELKTITNYSDEIIYPNSNNLLIDYAEADVGEAVDGAEHAIGTVAVVGADTDSHAREVTVVMRHIVARTNENAVCEAMVVGCSLTRRGGLCRFREAVAIHGAIAHFGRDNSLKTMQRAARLILVLQPALER